MIPFLTPEQTALRTQAAEITKKYVAPIAAHMDDTDEFPRELADRFGELGYLQLAVPEAYGGPGGRITEACILREEIAKASVAASLIACNNTAGGVSPLLCGGSEELRRKYLGALATGKHLTCFAITEAEAGSDVSGMKTRAVRDGDQYVINGSKCFITLGNLASFCTVFAKTGPDADGTRAISAFFVETSWPGFVIGKNERKMGINGLPNVEVRFEDLRVPATHRLGEEGGGFRIAMDSLNRNRATIGAVAVGLSQGAADYALAYAKQRQQFKKPILRFQGVQFMLADMFIQLEAARSLVYRAAALLDGGLPDSETYSAMCKCFASDVAMKVTTDAVQVLGGYGYMKDHPVERMMRDAKITQIFEGTNQIQRLVVMRHAER